MRAFCTRELPRATATFAAIWFTSGKKFAGATTPAQNWAASVWSAVRVVLSKAPRSLTWLKAANHSGLVRAGGGPGRNCEPLWRHQGVTCGHWGAAGGPGG